MTKATTLLQSALSDHLRCVACGNEDRFDQLIGFAVNYVTNKGHVVRQMMSEVTGYRCAQCGADVEAPAHWELTTD